MKKYLFIYILEKDPFVNFHNKIVEIVFWGLPIQIFNKCRKCYLGDFRKEEIMKK